MSSRIIYTIIFSVLFCLSTAANAAGEEEENYSFFVTTLGYDFMYFEDLIIHSPAIGVQLFLGDHNVPFNQINRRFSALALYQTIIFQGKPVLEDHDVPHIPGFFHHIDINLDGRFNRHQFLFKFFSDAEGPLVGGYNSFQIGAAWGYEILRLSRWSAILGAAYSYGRVWLISPYLRFGIDTKLLAASLDLYLPYINLSFAIAPKSIVRFTTDIRMDTFRVNHDYVLWVHSFGIGVKVSFIDYALINNKINDFVCACGHTDIATFELSYASVFAVMNLSHIRIEGGFMAGEYHYTKSYAGSPGFGFFISVKGTIPIF